MRSCHWIGVVPILRGVTQWVLYYGGFPEDLRPQPVGGGSRVDPSLLGGGGRRPIGTPHPSDVLGHRDVAVWRRRGSSPLCTGRATLGPESDGGCPRTGSFVTDTYANDPVRGHQREPQEGSIILQYGSAVLQNDGALLGVGAAAAPTARRTQHRLLALLSLSAPTTPPSVVEAILHHSCQSIIDSAKKNLVHRCRN